MENFSIHVKFSTGKIITFQVNSSDTVAEVKEKINQQENISRNFRRNLLFNSNQLEDDRKIRDYGIQNGSILEIKLVIGEKMQIKVKTEETAFVLDVQSSDTIQEINKKIQDKKGVQPAQLILIFAGKTLEADRTLKDYNIQNNSEVNLHLNKNRMA